MINTNNTEFINKISNDVESDEELASKLKATNLYLTRHSKYFPGRVEKVQSDGRSELCPIGMTLMDARVQQRVDSQKAGL